MDAITLRSLDASDVSLPIDVVDGFAQRLRGELIRPDAAGYDAARAVWNAMVDSRPGLIARCTGAADVIQCVAFAAEHGVLIAVRGGGHNIAGLGTCDGGLVADLSAMSLVHVDPEARVARVGPGATLGDFDREAQVFGLATPLGINSTTGVAGLALGGGFGWLTRRYGLTSDNLLSADIVTADGRLLTVSENRHPDLFWAIRGGGGNFGIVTSFQFKLHPVGPDVLAGLVVYSAEEASRVLRGWRDFTSTAPEEMAVWTVQRQAPPLPFLPEEIHGRNVVVLAIVHTGDLEKAERDVAPLRTLGTPVGEMLGPTPFAAFQTAFDPLLTPGARNYWKSHDIESLSDAALDAAASAAAHLPSPHCEVFLGHLAGAMTRIPVEATAYPGRNANFAMNVHARWTDSRDDEACIGWARGVFDAMAPFATGGAYVNFMTGDEKSRVDTVYGRNLARLRTIKGLYDPQNLFRVNHNILPERVSRAA